MSKELNGLSDWVLSHWFPMGKSFQAGAGWKPGSEEGVRGARPN